MKKIYKIFAVLMVCFAFLLFMIPSVVTVYAAEPEVEYSNVLDDLKKDERFNVKNYPAISNPKNENYGMLSVIQVAESENNELFIYVYQPSGQTKNLKASSINISLSRGYDIDVHNYNLKYLNSDGVFYKYKVYGLTVKNAEARYYTIVSILRPFDESIDEQASGGNIITEVVYDVSKEYCFAEMNGTSFVNCLDIETIRVTNKFVGYVYYPSGFWAFENPCESHFVAFNTDKPIDKLLSAKVYYTRQAYSYRYEKNGLLDSGKVTEYYGPIEDKEVSLKYTDKAEYDQGGWFGQVYTWDRIQTVEDFIDTENRENVYHMIGFDITTRSKITDAALTELQDKKWVLRFAETSSYYSNTGNSPDGSVIDTSYGYTMVGDVSILELKFETDGVVYHLGVIDNKQTGSRDPINSWQIDIKAKDWVKILIALLLLIVFLVVFMPILTPILSVLIGFIVKVFVGIIEIIFDVLTFPLRLIGKLFDDDKRK